jgi:hypothetical protein
MTQQNDTPYAQVKDAGEQSRVTPATVTMRRRLSGSTALFLPETPTTHPIPHAALSIVFIEGLKPRLQ